MRDQSLFLRILVLAVLLPTAAVVCVFALVVTGTLHPRLVHMAAAGGAILIIAVLASALSVFTPKYRPTPLLTPLFAGVFAALLASTAIYAVHASVTAKRQTVAAVASKLAPAEPAAATAPAAPAALAAIPAEPAQEPAMAPRTSFDTSAFGEPAAPASPPPAAAESQPAADTQPMTADNAEPLPADTADRAAMGGPFVDAANAVVPSAQAAEQAPAGGEAATAAKTPVAVARIPVPAAAPEETAKPAADATAPINLTASFDPSGPTEPAASGPPMTLDVADAVPVHHKAIPPLPRIRPCGGAGPACP